MATNMAITFETPNQLPLRFLCVPITIALTPFIARIGNLYGWLLVGAVSPFFIAWNFEVGVQCMVALGFATFLKASRLGIMAVRIGGAVFIATFALTVAALLLVLFDMPLGASLTELGTRVAVRVEAAKVGFGGTAYFIYVPFIVLMGHALLGFFKHLRNLRLPEPLTEVQLQSAAIVGLIIVLGPYAMGRYAIWNMWIPMLLYVLWIMPKLAGPDTRIARVWAFTMIAVAMPFTMGTPVTQIAKTFKPARLLITDSTEIRPCLDGLLTGPELCTYVEGKARELKLLGGGETRTLWLSSLTLMMHRLTDTDSAMSQRSLFFLGHRKELFDPLVDDLIVMAPDTILTDKVTSGNVAGIPQGVRNFQHRLVTQAGYELVNNGVYWHVYKKPEN